MTSLDVAQSFSQSDSISHTWKQNTTFIWFCTTELLNKYVDRTVNLYAKVCSQVELTWNINLRFLETKTQAGFHTVLLSWSNWNLEIFAEWGRQTEKLRIKAWSKVMTMYGTRPESNPGQISRQWVLWPLKHPSSPRET